MTSLIQIALLLLDVVFYAAVAHLIVSWLVNLRILNLGQPFVAQLWDALNRLMEPIYGRIRQFLPQTGSLDLAPLVLLLGIYALRIILRNNMNFSL